MMNELTNRGTPRKNSRGMSVSERLEFHSERLTECGCQIWMAGVNSQGYGQLSLNSKTAKAHRVSYAEEHGEIPEGMNVLHFCDTPACINPDHLFLGTLDENNKDRNQKQRQARGESHACALLTEEDIPIIKQRYADGDSIAAIARRYSMSHGAIWKVVNGITWRHVNG